MGNSKLILLFAVFFLPVMLPAQVTTPGGDTGVYEVNAYLDTYFSYYTDTAYTNGFQQFPTISARSNSFGLNIFLLHASFKSAKWRAVAGLHTGDIPAATWDSHYNLIQEANIGYHLFKKLWVDAGFFRTHFGTEYLLPKENITSSVTIGTFYEPYFESGVKLNYDPTDKLEVNLFLLNGYGIFVDNNARKSLGLGVTYVFNDYCNAGYTAYYGNDEMLNTVTARGTTFSPLFFAENAFINYSKKKFTAQAGFDVMYRQSATVIPPSNKGLAVNGLVSLRYRFKKAWSVYGRYEYFNDADAVLSLPLTDLQGKLTGLRLMGYTVGFEYKPSKNSYIRIEGRDLQTDKQPIFNFNRRASTTRIEAMINMGITFDLAKGTIIL
jgi:hypothetical protein